MANPKELFRRLSNVDYILIDKLAAALHGLPVLAESMAIFPRCERDSNENLARALSKCGAKLELEHGIIDAEITPELLETGWRQLPMGKGHRLHTDFGIVDIAYLPDGLETATWTPKSRGHLTVVDDRNIIGGLHTESLERFRLACATSKVMQTLVIKQIDLDDLARMTAARTVRDFMLAAGVNDLALQASYETSLMQTLNRDIADNIRTIGRDTLERTTTADPNVN